MQVSWSDFKNFVDSRSLSIQGIETDSYYSLKASDDYFDLECEIYKSPTDETDLDDFEANYKSSWNQKIKKTDSNGNPYVKELFSDENKKLCSRVSVFTTGQYGSLKNKDSEGSDIEDIEIHFFDSSRQELIKGVEESVEDFQARLDTTCKFTWLYFTPVSTYGISKGRFMYKGTPSGEFNNWLEFAPHISKAYDGSVACLNGAFPLDMIPEGIFYEMDGRSCLIIEQDLIYYSHRMGHKIEHEIGDKIRICSIFDIYI
jgi:hypothetical protein